MPVATQGSLKGLTPKQLEDTSCRLCLNNTYHLYDSKLRKERQKAYLPMIEDSNLDKPPWTR